jgi:hypothetical protein
VQQRERGSFKCARNKLDVRSRQYLRAMTKIVLGESGVCAISVVGNLTRTFLDMGMMIFGGSFTGGRLLVSNHYRGNVGRLGSRRSWSLTDSNSKT